MFQFSGCPSVYLCIQYTVIRYCLTGFPHSEICGSMFICNYPQLIAAYHVLLRLLMPRHSPYALISLTFSWRLIQSNYMSLSLLRKNHSSFKIAITFNILKTLFLFIAFVRYSKSNIVLSFQCSWRIFRSFKNEQYKRILHNFLCTDHR